MNRYYLNSFGGENTPSTERQNFSEICEWGFSGEIMDRGPALGFQPRISFI